MSEEKMKLIKELIFLICKLFTKANKGEELKLKQMKYFPFKRYKYLMWCGYAIYREDKPELAEMDQRSITHETIHYLQAIDKKFWIVFYASYLWNRIKNNPFSHLGYFKSRYELEAYAKEDDKTYPERRERNAHKKFYLSEEDKKITISSVIIARLKIRYKDL